MSKTVSKFALVAGLVLAMAFTFSCSYEEENYSGIIDGVWNLVDFSNNRTGSIITISDGKGVLTAIGEDDIFTSYSNNGQVNIGDAVIRSISYKGEWDGLSGKNGIIYWTCENYFAYMPNASWSNGYISYNTKEDDGLFVYTSGDPSAGFGFRFRK